MREDFEREQNALESQDRFRLAALDERMKAHQTAFALGRRMLPLVHSPLDAKMDLLKECNEFWNSSALYLTAEAREAFRLALHYLDSYDIYFQSWKHESTRKEERRRDLEQAFEAIQSLPLKLATIVDRESSGRVDYLKDESVTPFENKEKGEIKP